MHLSGPGGSDWEQQTQEGELWAQLLLGVMYPATSPHPLPEKYTVSREYMAVPIH